MFNLTNSGSLTEAENSLIDKDVKITGSVSALKPIIMFGQLNGNLDATSVHIASTGVVNGDIKSGQLKVEGKVNGMIIADQVHIAATANVKGEVQCKGIVIDEGATIEAQFTKESKVNG